MNLELCKLWGISEIMNEEDWEGFYSQKLFDLKKIVLEQVYLPKLIKKRIVECEAVVRILSPDMRFVVLEPFVLPNLHSFEEEMSLVKLNIHQSQAYVDLYIALQQLQMLQEAYRLLIEEYTDCWGEEWKSVEVNSREIFPSGLFLQSLKDGKSIEDWKELLLKERKRITIVY
ncbi:MAG: hypothetical protein RLY35_2164 [Bacteroidota bacterium]